jgi:hypothetical protein
MAPVTVEPNSPSAQHPSSPRYEWAMLPSEKTLESISDSPRCYSSGSPTVKSIVVPVHDEDTARTVQVAFDAFRDWQDRDVDAVGI